MDEQKGKMMKRHVSLAVATLAALALNAQTLEGSKTLDNWYIGVNGGVNVKTTQSAFTKDINPSAGLRIGRAFTPVLGVAVEGEVYFDNKGSEYRPLGTFVKGINVSLLGTTNFSNWLWGYKGAPRCLEVIGVYGLGWGHLFHTAGNVVPEQNVLTSKLGIDLAFNLGKKKAWQLYIEPNITYGLNPLGSKMGYNVNNSAVGVLAGINYKFGCSNGTHNFKLATLRDAAEVEALNQKINELRAENDRKDNAISNANRTIVELRQQLTDCQNRPVTTTITQQVVKQSNVLQPTVIFGQGKRTIDAAQYASIAMVANYMKKHKEAKVLIKGYASPEGSKEINQRISEARANAVKEALVNRYKIDASRLTTQGMGATDELFEEVDFNRVATFTDINK